MLVASVPLVVALKASEAGRILFFVGALVALLALQHAGAVRLVP